MFHPALRTFSISVAISTALAILCCIIPSSSLADASAPIHMDVLIQAGHEGRPDCFPGGESASLCGNTGSPVSPGEIAWTPIVADEATRVLRAAGVSVLRMPGHLKGKYSVRDAVFLHFDGADVPCSSTASVGYPNAASGKTAAAWKSLYGRYWPYGFMDDNFTSTLHGYYGFNHVNVSDGAFVIEGGEMSCPKQYAWLKSHLKFEGDLLAYFLSRRIGNERVPLPTSPSR